MKNAYLILAHNEFELLRLLVSSLDDSRNDIFIHFDKKVRVLPELHISNAGLFILDNRVNVYWGDSSIVEAEFNLFEAAISHGDYDYCHLLSGVDLPIKSQDHINQFLSENAGKEFIGYTFTELAPEVIRKVQRYHLFPHSFRSKNLFVRALRSSFLKLQEILGVKRNKDVAFKKGSQWISVTGDFVKYVLSRKEETLKIYRNSFCSDEIFMQTLCWNSPFRDNIYNTTEDGKGCMRMISWHDGQMTSWSMDDLNILKESDALFARKFSSIDMNFIQEILKLND